MEVSKIVTVKNLEKSYDNKKAVKGISFEVYGGEILGFLGPNGAGKSTTINILATVLKNDGGEVNILGHDLKKEAKLIKRGIGIVPQDLAIYEEIEAEENVSFFASLYGFRGKDLKDRVKEALELVGLYDRRGDKPKTFSGGMKRRLNIACAIAHNPKLIIMDEPTVGIDPQSRNHILESIKTLRERGATIIYSTHYMEEVEAISDRIIIMNEGKIIAEGTKEELKKKVDDEITYSFALDKPNKFEDKSLYEVDGVTKVVLQDGEANITTKKSKDNFNEIISKITQSGCRIESMKSIEASLETVFLELTGKSLRD
ncbi:ABC-2 type transport system ATP-binding protein [Clostridium acetobutylicum]|uniref:ABC-type MDR transporter, ATPase component n=1 Tax=Clostridium acetobutylicum (strain ATCC 824 / DSM 792 / JCM 1419 / IAM 19013 / LMG 5710 / NBRC 13948 / NRRL B-527 / VKM B-1787 / 2291 / W) TaxID=272562 RepID=Q97DR7_CLOAB|nr:MULTISPECIES: ABC transporter ATP-binding protein [Clostridium]AAK81335.1 ABC-type MDR transporter, ATPase component [Clostridium acetobutylicum ATCC 824]AEI32825.1 ABC-type MDR transporter, ATPase component [Clostridium acetobutylicum DSM 1731]AWV80998.1 ABC transporter ATP-binding protein [Clostridium acetobutylicum]MBC2395511.1 ABC transporter ATP-binding protein [Clostridium acetobutylicum]MBC2584275.1 ABC transporter ATP-binding protein [Clostridium acetobutylicum]